MAQMAPPLACPHSPPMRRTQPCVAPEPVVANSSVWATDQDAALLAVAEEIADSGEIEIDTPEAHQRFIDMITQNWADAFPAIQQLRLDMQKLFAAELFPDGCARPITMKMLGMLLAANRETLLIPEAPASVVPTITDDEGLVEQPTATDDVDEQDNSCPAF